MFSCNESDSVRQEDECAQAQAKSEIEKSKHCVSISKSF